MKDIIEVFDENSNKKQMEVVTTFTLEEFDYNYIIYRELDGSHYYVAKYKGENMVDLNTNLSKEELILCNKVFKEVIKTC